MVGTWLMVGTPRPLPQQAVFGYGSIAQMGYARCVSRGVPLSVEVSDWLRITGQLLFEKGPAGFMVLLDASCEAQRLWLEHSAF